MNACSLLAPGCQKSVSGSFRERVVGTAETERGTWDGRGASRGRLTHDGLMRRQRSTPPQHVQKVGSFGFMISSSPRDVSVDSANYSN